MTNFEPTPVQDLPENQDPGTAYVIDEMTGIKTPLVVPEETKEAAKKKKPRGRPVRELGSVVEPDAVDVATEAAAEDEAPEGDEE